jgi:hypothetical protein
VCCISCCPCASVCGSLQLCPSCPIGFPPPLHQEAEITRLLQAPGDLGIPGCVGARNIRDNLSDLRAQVAANQRGILLVRQPTAAT